MKKLKVQYFFYFIFGLIIFTACSYSINAPKQQIRGNFDTKHAVILAWASELAYKDGKDEEIKSTLESKLKDLNIHNFDLTKLEVETFKVPNNEKLAWKNDVKGFVASTPSHIIISIKGTEFDNFNNWFTNVSAAKVSSGVGGTVHLGFKSKSDDLWDKKLKTYLEKEEAKDKKIFITGHSLGAAIAQLVAVEIIKNYPNNFEALYSFGTPRVGDQTFVDYYNKQFSNRSFQFVNGNDPVPGVTGPFARPATQQALNFNKEGNLFWGENYKGTLIQTLKIADPTAYDKYHSIPNYRKLLEKHLQHCAVPGNRLEGPGMFSSNVWLSYCG